jgi:hypothetical protein
VFSKFLVSSFVKITIQCGLYSIKRKIRRNKVGIFEKEIIIMRCTFNAYLINDHYSQEHADAQHGGAESENNRKYLWEDELNVTAEVSEVICHENGVYALKGEYPEGNFFEYDVPEMLLYEIKMTNADPIFLGASRQIIEGHIMNKNENEIFIKLYLKDNEPFSDPVPGIYIASQSFPKALVF